MDNEQLAGLLISALALAATCLGIGLALGLAL